jgi:hypothetical protein
MVREKATKPEAIIERKVFRRKETMLLAWQRPLPATQMQIMFPPTFVGVREGSPYLFHRPSPRLLNSKSWALAFGKVAAPSPFQPGTVPLGGIAFRCLMKTSKSAAPQSAHHSPGSVAARKISAAVACRAATCPPAVNIFMEPTRTTVKSGVPSIPPDARARVFPGRARC